MSDDHDHHDHDHDHDHDHHSTDHDLLVAKCTAMACMFAATIFFGCIPFMLNRCFKWTDNKTDSRSAKIVQYLLYFGGGVLLATTFVHLLPEVKEVVEHLQECVQIPETRFALAETIMCAGFFIMFFIEECIHAYLHRHKKEVLVADDGVGAAFERGHSVRHSVLLKGVKRTDEDCQEEAQCSNAQMAASESCDDAACDNKPYLSSTLTVNQLIEPSCGKHTDLQLQLEAQHSANGDHHQQQQQQHQHQHQQQHHYSNGHGHSHLPMQTNENEGVVTSSLRGLGIVLALSLHEIFEGLAIGLEDSTDSVWFLFAAVSAHKLVLAFCVGVELIVARTKPILAAVYTITFAIVSPIGIGVGLAVKHNSSASEDSLTSAILQGIACGTLLYVVFFEILSTKHTGYGSFVAMVIGFGLMLGLQNIGEEEHSHVNDCPSTVAATTMKALMDVNAAKVYG